jgi:hypothetical protein
LNYVKVETVAGWTATNSTLASVAGGQSGNCLEITNSTTAQGVAYQNFTTVVNQNYTLSLYYKNGTASSSNILIGYGSGGGQIKQALAANANWTLYTVNFKADTTTTSIGLYVGTTTSGNTSLFDTVSVKALTATNLNGGFELQGSGEVLGSELLSNPGFETAGGGGADVFANWTEFITRGTVADETTLVKSGSHALKAASNNVSGYAGTFQTIAVTAGTRYKLTFWTRGDGTNAGEYSASNGNAPFEVIVAKGSTGVTGTTYTQITKYFIVPAGYTVVYLELSCPVANGGIAYFDDVSLKAVTAYAPFLNWSAGSAGTSTVEVSTSSNTGTYSAIFTNDAASIGNNYSYLLQAILTATHKYKISAYAKANITSTSFYFQNAAITLTDSYALYTSYFTATNTQCYLQSFQASRNAYIDDVTLICTEIPSAAGIAAGLAIDGNLCASFNGTSQYLSVASNASLQTGDIAFTVFGWVKLQSLALPIPSIALIVGKYLGTGNQREWGVTCAIDGSIAFNVSPDGQSGTVTQAISGVNPVNTWIFFVGKHDSAANVVTIQLNNGTTASVSYPSGVFSGTSPFSIGARTTPDLYGNLLVDGVGFIKRTLTASEITALYNTGKGVKFAGLPSTVSSDATLSFWNLDEYSAGTANVTRNDSKGTNHLTSTGNTPSAQGVNYFEGVVSKWFDQSGNSNTVLQTTQSARLMYVTNAQNSKPVLRGDGLTKSLFNAADLVGIGDVTVFAVIKPRGWGGGTDGRIIDNGYFKFHVGATGIVSVVNASVASSAAGSIVLGTAYVVLATVTAAGVTNIFINGTLSGAANQASGARGSVSPTYIGNNSTGVRGFDGDIGEVGIVNRIVTAAEIAHATAVLRQKWGI